MHVTKLAWTVFFFFFRVGKNEDSLFLERPGKFSGPESYFVFTVFTFRIKISIILKMIQWNYQLTKQNWLVCELLWNCATIFSARKQLLKNCFWKKTLWILASYVMHSLLTKSVCCWSFHHGTTQRLSGNFNQNKRSKLTRLIIYTWLFVRVSLELWAAEGLAEN